MCPDLPVLALALNQRQERYLGLGTRTQPTEFSCKHQPGFIEDSALGNGRETFQSLRSSFLCYDMMDSRPSISACPFCTQPFKSPGAFANHLKKVHPGQSHPITGKRATSRNDQRLRTDTLEENISTSNDVALCSPFADYSELDLIPLGRGKVMDLRPSHRACPFCNRPFKSPGSFANHLEKIHPGQSLSIKRKQATSSNNQSSETISLGENISGGNLYDALCSQFADYSELTDLIPRCRDKDERREEMPYGDDSPVRDRVNDASDANALFDDTIYFPVDREARKVVAPYPFQKPRDPRYNFL